MLARAILLAALVLAALLLPGYAVFIVSLIGVILYPLYLEGPIVMFLYELASRAPTAGWEIYFPWTIVLIGAVWGAFFFKSRLMIYNQ